MSRFSQTIFFSIGRSKNIVAFLSRHMAAANLFLFVLTVALAAAFVVQVNFSTTKGYRLRELENSISRLKLDNQVSQARTAEIRSMENITAKVPMLGMVKAGTPEYVSSSPAVSMNY